MMINMNIKPRLPRLESGAIVEHRNTGYKGFIVEDTEIDVYRVAIYQNNGSLSLTEKHFKKSDYGMFLTIYKVLAQRNEYHAKIEQK